MNILAIIPARGGSKGIPRKNIKWLSGKPLIAYSIQPAIDSGCFAEVMVSTEDTEVARIAVDFGASLPFLRPVELATDTATSIAVVQNVLQAYNREKKSFDAICLLQPTSPFRSADLICKAVQQFINSDADTLLSVRSIPHEFHPDWVLCPDETGAKIATGLSEFPTRRQDLRPAYHRDGAIYLTKSEVIESGTLYGNEIELLITDHLPYVNLDTLDDWEIAEKYFK